MGCGMRQVTFIDGRGKHLLQMFPLFMVPSDQSQNLYFEQMISLPFFISISSLEYTHNPSINLIPDSST